TQNSSGTNARRSFNFFIATRPVPDGTRRVQRRRFSPLPHSLFRETEPICSGMHRRFRLFRGAFLPAFLIAQLLSPLSAKELSLEQAQALRADADLAGASLDRAIAKVEDPAALRDAKTAELAIARVAARLDVYIAELKAAEAAVDIYDAGKKY